MAGKYTKRISVAVDPELEQIYRDAADALGMGLTTWIREWLLEGVPTMQAIIEAKRQGGIGPLQAFMRSALAQGQQAVTGFESERAPKDETA